MKIKKKRQFRTDNATQQSNSAPKIILCYILYYNINQEYIPHLQCAIRPWNLRYAGHCFISKKPTINHAPAQAKAQSFPKHIRAPCILEY